MTQVIILTPWALILAERQRVQVEEEQRFDDLTELSLRRWLGSFTLVMRTRAGRRWTLPLYKDQFAEAIPASFAQEVFIYATRFAAARTAGASDHR